MEPAAASAAAMPTFVPSAHSAPSRLSGCKRSFAAIAHQHPLPTVSSHHDEATTAAVSEAAAPKPKAYWGSLSSLGARSEQQDTLIAETLHVSSSQVPQSEGTPQQLPMLFGVFDGHGGTSVSSFLAARTSEYVGRALHEAPGGDVEEAFKNAFYQLDQDLPEQSHEQMEGSTAVCVLLDKDRIVCANCGDSRAVLATNGGIVALSDDHKPEREDEEERIVKAGGRVVEHNGYRVMGVLSMSRAIGDRWLHKFGVIPEPEVVIRQRCAEDEFLLLASDGLWEVFSNEDAISVARRCFERAAGRNASRLVATRIACKVLVKAAAQRGSTDNVTVVVVDLQPPEAAPAAPAPTTARTMSMPEPLTIPTFEALDGAAGCPDGGCPDGLRSLQLPATAPVTPTGCEVSPASQAAVKELVRNFSDSLAQAQQQQQVLCRLASQHELPQQPQVQQPQV